MPHMERTACLPVYCTHINTVDLQSGWQYLSLDHNTCTDLDVLGIWYFVWGIQIQVAGARKNVAEPSSAL